MDAKVIQLNAPTKELRAVPLDLWKLRWRIQSVDGVTLASSWLPETRYPSLSETLKEFADRIGKVYIDGIHRHTGEKQTLLTCSGWGFVGLSYKAFMLATSGRTVVGGLEVETVEGTRYLVLRDGTVHVEERKTKHVANDN